MNDVDNNVLIFKKVIDRIILPKYPVLKSLTHIPTHWNPRVGYEYFVLLDWKTDWREFTDRSYLDLKNEIENEVENLFQMLGFNISRSRGQDEVRTIMTLDNKIPK